MFDVRADRRERKERADHAHPEIYRRSREVFASEWFGPGGTPAQADAYAEAVMAESAARGVPVAIRLFDGRRGVPEGQALPIWSDPSFRDAVMQYLMA